MIELTDAQEKILGLLRQAVRNDNFQEVQNVLDNKEHNDIQAVLSHEGTLTSDKGTILNDVIDCSNASVSTKVEVIELIWKEADQKTRDFLCCCTIDNFRRFGSYNIPALKTVIQEMEEHKRVRGFNDELRVAITRLNVDQVKVALENCGEDVESVLTRNVYWSDGNVDDLLVYPLKVRYSKELNQEDVKKIKEITKLLWDKASPNVRNFWLESHMINEEGQNTGDNYIIDSLEKQQGRYADIAGEGWLEDFIQEVKDYRRQRDIKLNGPILEEEDKQALELARQESLLTAPIATNTTEPTTVNQAPVNNGASLPGNKKKNTVGTTATPVNSSNTSPRKERNNLLELTQREDFSRCWWTMRSWCYCSLCVGVSCSCISFNSFGSSYINGCWYC